MQFSPSLIQAHRLSYDSEGYPLNNVELDRDFTHFNHYGQLVVDLTKTQIFVPSITGNIVAQQLSPFMRRVSRGADTYLLPLIHNGQTIEKRTAEDAYKHFNTSPNTRWRLCNIKVDSTVYTGGRGIIIGPSGRIMMLSGFVYDLNLPSEQRYSPRKAMTIISPHMFMFQDTPMGKFLIRKMMNLISSENSVQVNRTPYVEEITVQDLLPFLLKAQAPDDPEKCSVKARNILLANMDEVMNNL